MWCDFVEIIVCKWTPGAFSLLLSCLTPGGKRGSGREMGMR
jgi:hypothetical protein